MLIKTLMSQESCSLPKMKMGRYFTATTHFFIEKIEITRV